MRRSILGIVVAAATILPAFAFGPDSGLKVGEMVTPFHPTHVTGPLKGTDGCPPCTYGNRPQVQVWVNGDDHKNVFTIAKTLDDAIKANKKSEFKAFVIVLTDNPAETKAHLAKLAEKTGDDVALAFLKKGDQAVGNYKVKIAPDVKNTVFVYRDRTVKTKFVNLVADEKGLAALKTSIQSIAH